MSFTPANCVYPDYTGIVPSAGRLVKRRECFELIREGAVLKEPSLVLRNADADLAVTPLMKQLAEDPVYTVAQFAQAVGALYFGCLGLCAR